MKRAGIIKEAERELSSGGYATVLAGNMHTFADVFAERMGRKFIIKAVYNIDSVTRKEAEALSKLSQFMGAEPLVLGRVSKSNKLKNNVSYYRFSIRCISPDSLPALASGNPDLIASKSVGLKVKIDESRLRELRKIGNKRLADLAKEAKISRSTLYKHERHSSYAAIGTVSRLERILNGSIRSESELLEIRKVTLDSIELESTGMQALRLHSAPFDIVAKKKNYYEISLDANSRTLAKRAAFFSAIRETFDNNYPFFLSSRKHGKIEGVPVVEKKEMRIIDSEEELLDLVY